MTALRRCFGCASPEKEKKEKVRSPQNPVAAVPKQMPSPPAHSPRIGLPWEYPHLPIRLFLLRHEQRGPDPTFHSSLTPAGYQGARQLAARLKTLNIHSVFSSPFLRTLQTVAPFCCRGNVSVHVEFALYELLADPSHSKFGVLGLPDIDRTRVRIPLDYDYSSVVPQSELRLSEGLRDVQFRVARFLQQLLGVANDFEQTTTTEFEGDGYTTSNITSAFPTTATDQPASTRYPQPASPSVRAITTPDVELGMLPAGIDTQGKGTWNILLVSHMHVVNSVIKLQDPEYGLNTHYSSGELTEVDVPRVRAGLRDYLRQVHEAEAALRDRRASGMRRASATQETFSA